MRVRTGVPFPFAPERENPETPDAFEGRNENRIRIIEERVSKEGTRNIGGFMQPRRRKRGRIHGIIRREMGVSERPKESPRDRRGRRDLGF